MGINFSCFWLKNYKKHGFELQHDKKAGFLSRRVHQITKNTLNAQQRSLHDCRIPQKNVSVEIVTVYSGFLCVCIPKSWKLRPGTDTKNLIQEFWIENRRTWSRINLFFFTLVALRLKVKDELMYLTASVTLNAKYYHQYMQEERQKSWNHRLYTLSKYILEQNRLGSHLLKHWQLHTLNFCQKASS